MEPASSWILVESVTAEPQQELPPLFFVCLFVCLLVCFLSLHLCLMEVPRLGAESAPHLRPTPQLAATTPDPNPLSEVRD